MLKHSCLALALIACQDKKADSGEETTPVTDSAEDSEEGTDTNSLPDRIDAGSFDIHIQSPAGGETGIALRVFHPAKTNLRYGNKAPIVLVVPGGWKAGHFAPVGTNEHVENHGYIYVELLLPGGTAIGIESGGNADRRGQMSQIAVIDAMRFLCGQSMATDGTLFTDHLPWADEHNLGVLGRSNGGNLALFALASSQLPIPKISWFASYESPIGDQFQTVELNEDPRYSPGECDPNSCNLDGLENYIGYDATQSAELDGFGSSPIALQGILFYDSNQNAIKDSDEALITGIPTQSAPWKIHPSTELRRLLQDHAVDIFQGPMPTWLASIAETDIFWANRDGASQIEQASANHPNMMVMVLQKATDHVQTQIDYPHTRAALDLWNQANHTFIRLNPDASYLSYLSQVPEETILEYQVGTLLNYPANIQGLIPDGAPSLEKALIPAGILELADRAEAQDFSIDLYQTLY